MTFFQLVFLLISALTLIAAWLVVTDRNLFHAAVALMVSFLGVAGLYVLLDAGFLAAAQLLVYIGAISILIIFAIMMTRRMMQTTESPFNSQVWLGIFATVITGGLLIWVIARTWPAAVFDGPAAASDEVLRGSVAGLGQLLVRADAYVLPFEIASVLLLAALAGAIMIALPEKEG